MINLNYPTGTITFLMTDIEGSTSLWDQHPEVMRAAMSRHDELIERAVAAHDGLIVRPRGEGDSRFAVFESAVNAVRAAAAIQAALLDGFAEHTFPLRIRSGLHTGAADWRDGDYYGTAVNRCARIRGLAHGGQTLVSAAVAELVRDDLPRGVELIDLGTHRLKGLARPETVFQLWLPNLPNDFPPLLSIDAMPGNLPSQPAPIIGRRRELADVAGLLSREDVRLVTLTGPGGTGKTRLSLEAGHGLSDRFSHGVFFVDLAPIGDASLVPTTIAHALGLREGGGRPPFDSLKEYLADKKLLLILDNLEQIIAAAPFVAQLLAGAPQVKILVTSRIPLQIRGEREYPLSTLPLPPAAPALAPADLLGYEAVQLFVQQAQAARPAFELGPANAAAVVAICRRLDGLPLAIQIAAARIRMLPPEAILKRLDRSMTLLVGGAADLPTRQQTVRNAIEWSFNLLQPEEKILFARLSVFVGGFTLENVEAVCNPKNDLDIFTNVETLLLNSLVRQIEWVGDEPRFDMLQTIRDYALEMLDTSGELESIRSAHANYFATRSIEEWSLIYGPQAVERMMRLEGEHDNYRSALAWGMEPDHNLLVTGQISVFLLWFWYRHGYLQEGREWSERILRATEGIGGVPRAMGLNTAGLMAMWQGDLDIAARHYAEAIEIVDKTGFDLGISMTHFSYGVTLLNQGHDREAYGHLTLAAERFDQMNDNWNTANTLIHLANASLALGQFGQAEGWLEEAKRIADDVDDPWQIAFCLNNFGEVARAQGDYQRARIYYERSEAIYKAADALGDHARLIHTLAYLALHDGDPSRGEELFRASLAAFQRLGNKRGIVECLAGLAAVGAAAGRAEWAAPLLAAADTQLKASGAAWWPADRVEVEHTRARLRESLDEAAFARLWNQGQGMALESAVDWSYALGAL
jgi:predicted ATPase/class 3 adenylate cyclase